MGKTPVFGVVGFCWLGLALAGCDTCNNTVPKDRYQARTTFGNPNKDATVSKNATPDAMANNKPAGMTPSEESTARLRDTTPANRPSGTGMLPETAGDVTRRSGQRSPGEAGIVDVAPADLKKPSGFAGDKPLMPVSGTEDASPGHSTLSTSNTPAQSAPGEPVLAPGSTGVALPPPPGSSGPAMSPPAAPGTALPPLSSQGFNDARPSSHPIASSSSATERTTLSPASGGMKPLDPPPAPGAMKPVEAHAPIYDAPPPPPPAPKAGEAAAAATDAPPPPPAPPTTPYFPGSPKQ